MAGRGRGVLRDFKMARVSTTDDMVYRPVHSEARADCTSVSIPYECAGWKSTGSKEGKLVIRLRLRVHIKQGVRAGPCTTVNSA